MKMRLNRANNLFIFDVQSRSKDFGFYCMFLLDIGVYDYNSRWRDKMDWITVAKFLSIAVVIVFWIGSYISALSLLALS